VKIRLHGHVQVPEEELDVIEQALVEHVRLTRAEPGCLRFDVTQAEDDPHRFNVHEEFVDRAAFERHQESVRSSKWGEVSTNVSRHYQIDEVG